MVNLPPEHLEYPKWQRPYLEAVLEADRHKLAAKLAAAEAAVFARSQELADSSNHHKERQALQNASAALRVLKRDLIRPSDMQST